MQWCGCGQVGVSLIQDLAFVVVDWCWSVVVGEG